MVEIFEFSWNVAQKIGEEAAQVATQIADAWEPHAAKTYICAGSWTEMPGIPSHSLRIARDMQRHLLISAECTDIC